ncbi:alpha-D-ribose 1-methylphosphonate 5-phosphate C-P-lyase PhnJ [Klebsiella pneumoniae subsp. pneumoniae]|nr:alpha-D-ribose 1-methylphosphonate 5-phosphate C-P-lyase PhnJ [Klebsiella pneumoniae subsp. pneumoniae]
MFGAGREADLRRACPYTPVESLDFDDHSFTVQEWDGPCRHLRLAPQLPRRSGAG